MKRIGAFIGLWLLLGWGVAQEQPLINYAAGLGEFEHDEDPEGRGDEIADGFTWNVSESGVFTPLKDLSVYVSGNGSQKITFSRNALGSASGTLTLQLPFPTEMYPQPGETVRISFWLKTDGWQNARYTVTARDYNGANSATLLSATNPIPNWTRFEANYTLPNATPNGIQVRFQIDALSGLSTGTIWIDNLEIYGSKRWQPPVQRTPRLFTYYRPTAPLANGDWIFYARNFDMLGSFGSMVHLRPAKIYRPQLRTLTYYLGFYSVDSPTWPIRDPFGYAYCNQNHPEWFLLTVLGQRARAFGNQYLMDVGNPACAAWAAGNMARRAQRANMGWDAIQLDSLIDFTNGFNLARYPTPASRTAATQKYLRKILEALAPYSTQIIGNAASAPYTRDRIHTLLLREGYLQGLLMEQAFTHIYSLPAEYMGVSPWTNQLNTLAEHPDKLRVVYSGYTANPARARRMKLYALGSFLLISDENAFLYLDVHYYENGVNGQRAWRPDEDFNVPLGQPTGPYEVFFRSTEYRGGLYYRPFENGFVLVNPTGTEPRRIPGLTEPIWKAGVVFSWVTDDTYWELYSQRIYPPGSIIKIYPKEARFFVRVGQALRNYPPAQKALQELNDSNVTAIPKNKVKKQGWGLITP